MSVVCRCCIKSFSVSAVSLLKRQLSCLIRRQLVLGGVSYFVDFLQEQNLLWTGWYRVIRDAWFEGGKARDSWKEFNFGCDSWIDSLTWGPFLETPETFWVYFGCCNFLRISKTKTFLGVKFCNKFALSYLEIIVKGQLSRISKWEWVNFRENWESNSNSWSIICF